MMVSGPVGYLKCFILTNIDFISNSLEGGLYDSRF